MNKHHRAIFFRAGAGAAAPTARQVILDMDFNTDAGDPGMVQVAFAAHQLGYHKVIGAIINTTATKVPGAFDAYRKWYGLPSIPIGVWKGTAKDGTNGSFFEPVYDHFERDVALAATVDDSTVAYRTMLAGATGKVDIIAGGYANCLDALLSSTADGISPLTGAQLITAKVNMLWWSAGEFPTSGTPEFNMMGGNSPDSTFCAMSDRVVKNWPSPITFAGFAYGETPLVDGVTLATKPLTDIRTYGRAVMPSVGTDTGGWDLQIVILSLDQTGHTFVAGANSGVNTTTGINTWVNNVGGKDRYAVKTLGATWYKDHIEALSCLDPKTAGTAPSWGTSSAIAPAVTWPTAWPAADSVYSGEMLANSTFNGESSTGWTGVNSTLSVKNGRLSVLGTAGYAIAWANTAALSIGVTYRVRAQVSFDGAPPSGENIQVFMKAGSSYTDGANTVASGTYQVSTAGLIDFTFVATTTANTFMAIVDGGNTRNYTLANCSVV